MQEKRTILFFGDSNTYGYDPADFWEGRYPKEKRWTYLLEEKVKNRWDVVAEGVNGRKIPTLKYDSRRIEQINGKIGPDDLFAVMLGTNDIVQNVPAPADTAAEKMEQFLDFLLARRSAETILVIAPPHISDATAADTFLLRFYEERVKMTRDFAELAEQKEVLFADAGEWGIGMAADQVHFSEKGHRTFAEHMAGFLRNCHM